MVGREATLAMLLLRTCWVGVERVRCERERAQGDEDALIVCFNGLIYRCMTLFAAYPDSPLIFRVARVLFRPCFSIVIHHAPPSLISIRLSSPWSPVPRPSRLPPGLPASPARSLRHLPIAISSFRSWMMASNWSSFAAPQPHP